MTFELEEWIGIFKIRKRKQLEVITGTSMDPGICLLHLRKPHRMPLLCVVLAHQAARVRHAVSPFYKRDMITVVYVGKQRRPERLNNSRG